MAAGADALGVDEILIVREPFSIAEKALQHMKLKAMVRVLDLPVTNSAKDSENAVNAFIDLGCRTIVLWVEMAQIGQLSGHSQISIYCQYRLELTTCSR